MYVHKLARPVQTLGTAKRSSRSLLVNLRWNGHKVNPPHAYQSAKARMFYACFGAVGLVESRNTDEIFCKPIKMQKGSRLLGVKDPAASILKVFLTFIFLGQFYVLYKYYRYNARSIMCHFTSRMCGMLEINHSERS